MLPKNRRPTIFWTCYQPWLRLDNLSGNRKRNLWGMHAVDTLATLVPNRYRIIRSGSSTGVLLAMRLILLALLFPLLTTAAIGQQQKPDQAADQVKVSDVTVDEDPYLWLEDVTGETALDWVRARNAKTQAKFDADPRFVQLRDDLLKILDSDERIPFVSKRGEYYYNFWRDQKNERGLWRRTTLEEYRKPEPAWEVVLDLDALAKEENENWVWDGASLLRPDYDLALIDLSRGGADASVTREFDLRTKQFVEGGFERPEAKGGMNWIDRDSVFVYTDFGPGTQTSSGYPRIAKLWRRGTPLADADYVYEGQPNDMYIAAQHDDAPGFERNFVSRTLAFYNDELYLRADDGTLTKIEAPNSANKSVFRDYLFLELREPWEVAGKSYQAGSLLIANFDDFLSGSRKFDVAFEPTENTSLASFAPTKDHVLLNVLEDVKNRIYVLSPESGGWKKEPLKGAPEIGTVGVSPVDADESKRILDDVQRLFDTDHSVLR
jgi:prolyl oligopeptidase